jgi:hypothetical protein
VEEKERGRERMKTPSFSLTLLIVFCQTKVKLNSLDGRETL